MGSAKMGTTALEIGNMAANFAETLMRAQGKWALMSGKGGKRTYAGVLADPSRNRIVIIGLKDAAKILRYMDRYLDLKGTKDGSGRARVKP